MHLHGRLPGDWGAHRDQPVTSPLSSRKEQGGPGHKLIFIVLGVVGAVAISVILAVYGLRRWRKRQAGQKGLQQGKSWGRILNPFRSKSSRYQATSSDESAELDPSPGNTNHDVEQAPNARANDNRTAGAGATVDRNTSVRSVLTLPAYSRAASTNEQVMGREGDRDGVDVVVDFPTEENEEVLREQEMDALYQLRQVRRQHNQEREEWRRQRREAQQTNDATALADLRRHSRAASSSNNNVVDELRRDINRAKENRNRSVSSVSYADLGVARHDGTRIRANSQESERMGLLSDAADMGHNPQSRGNSPQPHRRSASSVGSFDSDFPSPALSRPHGEPSNPATPRLSTVSNGGGRAGSSPELVDSDLGVEAMPPPEYEDVPLDVDGNSALRSTTPLDEPPPDYPGPYRSDSQRSQRSQHSQLGALGDETATEPERPRPPRSRGVGGVPQLPSLRIGRLPEIVIEPSTAYDRENNDHGHD